MALLRYLAVVALTATLAACGGGSSSPSTPDAASEPPAAVESASPPVAVKETKSECLPVTQALLDGIASGEESDVGGLKLSAGKAYKSPDYKNIYFVAAKLSAPGGDGSDVGVWATNSLQPGGGIIMAADGFAKQFTVWPDADKTKADISGADPGIDKAKDCIG